MNNSINRRLEDNEVFNINSVINGRAVTVKKIYKAKYGEEFRNIVEEDNTIYEIDKVI